MDDDSLVKRKITEPKPKRYIVEVRPPKKGERYLNLFGHCLSHREGDETRGLRTVIVEELA